MSTLQIQIGQLYRDTEGNLVYVPKLNENNTEDHTIYYCYALDYPDDAYYVYADGSSTNSLEPEFSLVSEVAIDE